MPTLEHRKGSQTNRKQGKDGKRVVCFGFPDIQFRLEVELHSNNEDLVLDADTPQEFAEPL
jgi:hypothetical protein